MFKVITLFIMAIVGIVCLWSAPVAGIGYALYLWQTSAISVAAFQGFILFLKLLIGGVALSVISSSMLAAVK